MCIAALIALTGSALGEEASANWPHWRGPKGDGLPAVTGIQKDWAGGIPKVWAVNNLCKGRTALAWSSPAVVGDRLVITGREETKDTVVCLDANTGTVAWKKTYAAPVRGQRVQYGEGPRATPWIDEDRVYTFGCLGHLACWNLKNGNQLWMTTVEKHGGQRPFWGHASSPLVYKNSVIVQGGGAALFIAFDKATGKVLWKSQRGKAGYSAPVLATVGEKPVLIILAEAGVYGLNPDDGKKLWFYGFTTEYGMNCSTPVLIGDDRVLITSLNKGTQGGAALLKLTANGVKQIWRSHAFGPAHNDPVLVDGHLYCYDGFSLGNRWLTCVDLKTGKPTWRTAAAGGPGNVLLVDGLLLTLGNQGKMRLLRPNPKKFEKIAEFQAIRGKPVWTVPVLVGDRMYVRFCNQLICYRITKTNG
jgi:outer membrane protein assembly factor BamB